MRLKKCKHCGIEFEAESTHKYLCDSCRAKAKQNSVYRERVCTVCGVSFLGAPAALYCLPCRTDVKRERDRRAKRAKRAGSSRKIGATDQCLICKADYTVRSGIQKYCSKCSAEAVKEKERNRKRKYAQENIEKIHQKKREMRAGSKVCTICGNPVMIATPTVTCSEDCARELRRQWQARGDKKRNRNGEIKHDI